MGVKQPSSRFNKKDLRNIEGRNPVVEALRANSKILEVNIEENITLDNRLHEIFSTCREKHIPLNRINSKKLRRMSKTSGNHQGVIAIAEYPELKQFNKIHNLLLDSGKIPFYVFLPGVMYEHNFGAVLRTCEATKVDGIILNKRGLRLTPVVSKTSVGASEYVPIFYENLFTTLKMLKKDGFYIFGLEEGNHKRIYNANLTKPTALIIGAEDSGISESINKLIDEHISIPMLGHIESLNMSVATSICLYEMVRQRKYNR